MNSISKVRVAKVFTIYLIAMFSGSILLNSLFKGQFNLSQYSPNQAEMETFACGVHCLMQNRWEALAIEHSDVTGLKRLINNKRRLKEAISNPQPRFVGNYKTVVYPPIPVKYQGELSAEKCALIRAEITAVSKKYLGRPYIYAAKGPEAFDCSGYTSYIMRSFGIEVSPGSRIQCLQGKHVDLSASKVGDLLFFSRYGKGGMITHVGLILENTSEGITVIHANGPRHGIMIENVTKSSYWKQKILFARNVIDPVTTASKAVMAENQP
jgi:cell wall-associated NlpC family hydrolase